MAMAPGLAIMLSGGLPSTTSALSGRRELGRMGKQGEKEKERNKREGKRKRRAGPLKERRASERRRGRGGQGAGDSSVFWVALRRGSRASSDQNSPSLARPTYSPRPGSPSRLAVLVVPGDARGRGRGSGGGKHRRLTGLRGEPIQSLESGRNCSDLCRWLGCILMQKLHETLSVDARRATDDGDEVWDAVMRCRQW